MKVLVDSSVWIDHFHRSNLELQRLLLADAVCTTGAVLGELIAGNLPRPRRTAADLRLLPRLDPPSDDAVFDWIESAGLAGTGLSWIDCQLLATARRHKVSLWTRDKALARAAAREALAWRESKA